MDIDQKLRDQLQGPQPTAQLESRIRENWQQQMADAVQQQQPRFPQSILTQGRSLAAGFVLLMLAGMSLSVVEWRPTVVLAALEDIQKDVHQQVGISIPVDTVLNDYQIQRPPKNMTVAMTKQCHLNGNMSMHLEVAGENQGRVHLFILKGGPDIPFWQRLNGKDASMPWQLIRPRPGLSVLVMQTPDMNSRNVEKLIHSMFYA